MLGARHAGGAPGADRPHKHEQRLHPTGHRRQERYRSAATRRHATDQNT